jgi:hypothetical protein
MWHVWGRRYMVLMRKPEDKRSLGSLVLDGRVILRWIF